MTQRTKTKGAARSSKYPLLPKTIMGPGGRVKVLMQKKVTHEDNTDCWGIWDEGTRTVKVATHALPRQQWHTFYHEVTHIAMTDSGLDDVLSNEVHEAICNAVATQRMRERFG